MKEQLKNLGLAGALALGGCGNEFFQVGALDSPTATAVYYRWTPPAESTRGLPRHSVYVVHSAGQYERYIAYGGRWQDETLHGKIMLAEDELGKKKARETRQWDF